MIVSFIIFAYYLLGVPSYVANLSNCDYNNLMASGIVDLQANSKYGWFSKFEQYKILLLLPILLVILSVFIVRLSKTREWLPLILSSINIVIIIAIGACMIYPFFMISAVDPKYSLTLCNASSSNTNLNIMIIGVLIFVPLILAYTFYEYYKFRGKVTIEDIDKKENSNDFVY